MCEIWWGLLNNETCVSKSFVISEMFVHMRVCYPQQCNCGRAVQATYDNIIWHMRITC